MTSSFAALLALLFAFFGSGAESYSSTPFNYGDFDYSFGDESGNDYDFGDSDFEWDDRNDIGATLETYYCSITIDSAQVVSSYGDITPFGGYKLVDVVITTMNTSSVSTYMTSDEYRIRWSENSYDYDWTWYDEDDAEGLAPYYDEADPGDTLTYHYLYEVPTDVENACIEYFCPYDEVYYWLFFPLDG